jgi:hypothetical protein
MYRVGEYEGSRAADAVVDAATEVVGGGVGAVVGNVAGAAAKAAKNVANGSKAVAKLAKAVDEVAAARKAAGTLDDAAGTVGNEAGTPGGGTTTIYRAVIGNEPDDIIKDGLFRLPEGFSKGKYFTLNSKDATWYAKQAFGKLGDTSPYTLIQTEAPSRLIEAATFVDRSVGAVLVPRNSLPLLSKPSILTHCTLPGK